VFSRILRFSGLPFLSAITPFLFLPILARVAGAEGWVAIALGQSIGTFGALVVSLGYNVVGPTLVHQVEVSERRNLLRVSVQARATIFVPVAITAFVVASLLSPDRFKLAAGIMALAMTIVGLSASWYMIGLGKPAQLLVFDVLPKLLATAIAAVIVIFLHGDVVWYPALLAFASICSLGVYVGRTVGRSILSVHPREILSTIRGSGSIVAAEVSGGSYAVLTVGFVSAIAPPLQAASYISGDKLLKIGQVAIATIGNALQGWVVEDKVIATAARRRRQALGAHIALGLAGLAVFATVAPWLSGFLFGQTVAIDFPTAVAFGVAVVALSLSTALTRYFLIPRGQRKAVLVSVLLGVAIGVPAIHVLTPGLGAQGAAWGLAAGELTVLIAQAATVLFTSRKQPRLTRRSDVDEAN